MVLLQYKLSFNKWMILTLTSPLIMRTIKTTKKVIDDGRNSKYIFL